MANRNLRIGFIGGGNMAQAMLGGLLEAGHDPACLHVADPSPDQRKIVQGINDKLKVVAKNNEVSSEVEILVLAVKPGIIGSVATGLREAGRPAGQLIVSIAAGVTLRSLQQMLDTNEAIVRIMPNQPALVGAGMSVMVGSASVNQAHRNRVQYVAEATGRAAWIEDESLMDAVTAVSGSGPAYFYLLMEIMEECARDMGLPQSLAEALVRQTGLGAGQVAAESALGLSELRDSVTSRGGTTQAAISVLEQANIRDIVRKALAAARDRSVEIGASSELVGQSDDQGDKNEGKNSQ